MDTTTNGQTPDINVTPMQKNDNIRNEGYFQAFVTISQLTLLEKHQS